MVAHRRAQVQGFLSHLGANSGVGSAMSLKLGEIWKWGLPSNHESVESESAANCQGSCRSGLPRPSWDAARTVCGTGLERAPCSDCGLLFVGFGFSA